jgi:predicted ABC-type ATPase
VNPQLVFIAGPNGAGKSTFYQEFLQDLQLPFLNADLLESRTGIPSLEAARILDIMRNELVEKRAGFITETVFSDPVGAKLGLLRKAVDAGYDVVLIYIGVEPPLCPLRVDQRVAAGGHDVPRDRIQKRFERSLANLRAALKIVPLIKVYDNSSVEAPFRLVAVFDRGKRTFRISPAPRWARSLDRNSEAGRFR